MNKNWQIPRRTFLRGMGTVVALPLLEAMLPGGKLFAETVVGAASPAAKAFPKRMAFIYIPNGVNMAKWTPAKTGTDYELSPTLAPLAPHQADINVLSGLTHKNAFGLGDGGGDHARACSTYLTGKHPKKSASDIHAGISVDQVAANAVGDKTRLPSLELSCDRGQEAGSCDSGYSCAYQFNISWRSETQPMNPEIEPKQAFERLFGGGTTAEARLAQAKRDHYDQSVLDVVSDQAKSLQTKLGTTDRRKLDEYFTSIRDVERSIQQNGIAPPVVPDGAMGDLNAEYTFERHMKLMFDLMALSFQTDTTRISSFLVSHDGGNRPYPFIGVAQGHHHISHHRNNPDSLARLAIIDNWHVKQFAYFLDKLKSIKEGDGNLLDNSMIVFGGGISDGNEHSHDNLPTIVAGRGGGTITPGRHLKFDTTPMSNFYVSLLNRMGVKTERFGDSTGALEAIA
jgi:Protein of unknown function (DUF1552)